MFLSPSLVLFESGLPLRWPYGMAEARGLFQDGYKPHRYEPTRKTVR